MTIVGPFQLLAFAASWVFGLRGMFEPTYDALGFRIGYAVSGGGYLAGVGWERLTPILNHQISQFAAGVSTDRISVMIALPDVLWQVLPASEQENKLKLVRCH